jgi:phospholipid/cholesterol/gamma-HCH transport system substrate-binding protein
VTKYAILAATILLGVGGGFTSVVSWSNSGLLRVRACFSHVGGLEPGSSVLVSGIRVGHVESVYLDPQHRACTRLLLRNDIGLDLETAAAIFTLNVLGEKYVSLEPGGSDVLLESGDELIHTQSALPVERLLIRALQQQMGSSIE